MYKAYNKRKLKISIGVCVLGLCLLSACQKAEKDTLSAAIQEISDGNYYAAIDQFTAIAEDKEADEATRCDALLYIAEADLMLEQDDEAIAAYEEALQYDEDNTELLIALGEALQKNGKTQDALEYYEQAVSYGDEEALPLVGAAYIDTDCFAEAESVLLRYIEKHPMNAAANYYLSKCCYALGKTEAALVYAENAVQLGDAAYNDILLYHMAVLYEDLGQWDKASAYMGAYVQAHPEDEKAQTEYTFITTRVSQ